MKRLILALALCGPIALTSCTPTTTTTPAPPRSSLQVVSDALLTTGQTIGALQTAVISAHQKNLLSEDVTRNILEITTKLAQAGKQADAITAGLAKLGTSQKMNLAGIFNPILVSITESLNNGLIPAGPATNGIRTMLTTLQLTLAGVQTALQGSN